MKILVTGFDPFGGEPVIAATEAIVDTNEDIKGVGGKAH